MNYSFIIFLPLKSFRFITTEVGTKLQMSLVSEFPTISTDCNGVGLVSNVSASSIVTSLSYW